MSTQPAPPTGWATPVFAVVGRANKGKSSVLATLAEDDSVLIGDEPGTTTECRDYPVRVDGRTLFALVDTPGFEQASVVLAWMEDQARGGSAAEHPEIVARFLAEFEAEAEFREECRLLRPVVDGASVLYVVDGAEPYRANYEAEMEILRWTGRPRMALINRAGDGDHSGEWRRALDQYFKVVRDFDVHAATFADRIRLLETFRELCDPWRAAIDEAIDALRGERERRRAEVLDRLTGFLNEALTHRFEVALGEGEELGQKKVEIEQRFCDELRGREQQARRAVAEIYGHSVARWGADDLERPVFERDLFAKETWRLLGLRPAQLVGLYAAAGAVAGGLVAAGVGGASFMLGAGLGAVSGLGFGV